jgi:hypothetical protein
MPWKAREIAGYNRAEPASIPGASTPEESVKKPGSEKHPPNRPPKGSDDGAGPGRAAIRLIAGARADLALARASLGLPLLEVA